MSNRRKPVRKIKFGGSHLRLGGGVISHFRGWGNTGDLISNRDLKNNFNKIIKRLIKADDIPYDFNPDGTINPPENLDKFTIESEADLPDHIFTGYYKLKYKSSETRKIPYYLNDLDLNTIVEEDLGGEFEVVNVGSAQKKSFGPYNFIAKQNGAKSAISILENFDKNHVEAKIQIDSAGGAGFPSVQNLSFGIPAQSSAVLPVNLESLDYNYKQEWVYRVLYHVMDLEAGEYTVSGHSDVWSPLNANSENFNFNANLDPSSKNALIQPLSIQLGNVYSGALGQVKGDPAGDRNEEVQITGVLRTRTVGINNEQKFAFTPIDIDLNGNNSFNKEYFSFGDYTNGFFTGSQYLNLNSIKINNDDNLKAFTLSDGHYESSEYLKSIDLSGCSNLSHFSIAAPIKNLTGLFLADCAITGFNADVMGVWHDHPSAPLLYEPSLNDNNKILHFDLSNNKLNNIGVKNIIHSININLDNGYLNIKNQNPSLNLDSDNLEMISELESIGWTVER